MNRILTVIGIILLVLSAVFFVTEIAGEAVMLLLIAGVIMVAIGIVTGTRAV